MRRTAGKALLGGVAVAMIATFVPTAGAAAGDTYSGPGCFSHAMANETIDPQGNQDGVIGVRATATDASNNRDPAATIACWIATPTASDEAPNTRLDTTCWCYLGEQPVTNNNGDISGQKQISYSNGVNHDQPVYLCEQNIDASGSTTTCTQQTMLPPVVANFDAAYCPYGSITGTGSWTTAETTALESHWFLWDTFANCPAGVGDSTGSYHVVFGGSANDACTAGSGSGTLSGSGPEGAITGSFTFYRIGIHLYISGSLSMGGEQYSLQYWLDVLASTNEVCSYWTAPLIGHGAIVEGLPA